MFYTFLLTRWRFFLEERKIRNRFYFNALFKKRDAHFKRLYRGRNPYRTSRLFLEKRGAEDVHVYGETPLTSMDVMAKKVGLTKEDHFLELGCGRGRTLFFLTALFGCRATGIEWIPEFVKKGKELSCQGVDFIEGDFFDTDLSFATVIYIYGTSLSDGEVKRLEKKFLTLKPGVKILSVSFPFEKLQTVGSFPIRFPWGKTEVYLQVV